MTSNTMVSFYAMVAVVSGVVTFVTLCSKKLTKLIAAAPFLHHPLGRATAITQPSGSGQGDLHVEEFLGQVPLGGLIFFILTRQKKKTKTRRNIESVCGGMGTWKMKVNIAMEGSPSI